ncbi:uncharacterized protein BDZ99DRAFT_470017 [Mytilinidion resinicola]|uniref:C2H2-type domain-containing protein n=1 Tax=Mytilinidion resinicola TaxID=574789 RepID=A0A6A6Z7B2_9PEZI|nr:uncharacterized protein BDZ99DRAFT_470017 [Mytilinidion resinicola]KAF2816946.1 hypothetical protein BDZ99DRAFT_470017 [Mytilinidion resinicola]
MSITFGTSDLLEYNARYSVLICRECKYAIQKSALGSHLLRHKIYRGERQRLLSSIAQLELVEPDDVQLPPVSLSPVEGLPVISGYRCTAIGCESLCASSKRMRRHWSENHGVSDPPESCARSVNLQTFFRGTKIKYFEVASPGQLVTGQEIVAHQHSLNRVPTPASILPLGPRCNLDLETLRYFHHFTTTTSLTLPARNGEPVKYWQMDVVAQALRLRWLTCGLLAISASHLAALLDDETTKRVHRERSAQFLQEFSAGWGEVLRDPSVARLEEAKAGAQMHCIQCCCHWTSEIPALSQGLIPGPAPFDLQSFTTTVQGCIDPNFALRSAVSSDDVPEETWIRATTDSGGSSDAGVSGNVPPALLYRFRILPYRMAEALEKPDNALDFVSTLSAIDTLVECFSLSYASDDVGAVWTGMASWLRMLGDRFNQMVLHKSPAALIVLAHWLLLVERAERYCWFLRGSAMKLLRQITGELPDDSAAQRLVGDLIGSTFGH